MIWVVLGIAVIIVLAYMFVYFFLFKKDLAKEDTLKAKKFFYKEKSCKPQEVTKFLNDAVIELKEIPEIKKWLESESKDSQKWRKAVLYFDSPRIAEAQGQVRVCAGLMFDKEVPLNDLSKEIKIEKQLRFDTINFSRGVSITHMLVPSHPYICKGMKMYKTFETFFSRNKDIKNSLEDYPDYTPDIIEFAELIEQSAVTFYRPIFKREWFQITTLPPPETKSKVD